MLKRRLILVFISAVLLQSMFFLSGINVYMTYKDTPVEVMQTYSGVSTGKHSTMQFIAIYRTNDNIIFDRFISAADYYQLEKGDKLVLNLRPYDVKQDWVKNMIWFFGAVVWYVIAGVFSLVTFLLAIWPDRRKKDEEK